MLIFYSMNYPKINFKTNKNKELEVFKEYPMYKNKNYGMLVWHASEIFNSTVQKSKPWVKLFGLKPRIYPEHKKIIKKIDNIWRPENKISTFLSKAFPLIKKWVDELNVNPQSR